MGKVAFLAAGVAVLLSGLPGCEVLLNVGGLTERGLDDAAVAADTSAASPVDGEALEGADAAEASADGPMTPTGPSDASGDEGPDRVADAGLSMVDSTPGDSTAAPEDTGAALDDAQSQDGGLDALDSAASTDGSSVTDGPVVADSQGATYRSCLAIFDAGPASASGTYSIAPGGTPIVVIAT